MKFGWLVFVFLPLFAQAQRNDTVAWRTTVLLKTNWPDPVSPLVPFQFSADILLKKKVQKVGRVWHAHFYSEAQWLAGQSFMADSLEQKYRPLAQLYFDCYEIEARRIQEEVNTEDKSTPTTVTDAMQRADSYIGYIRSVTKEGTDSLQMRKIRRSVDSVLSVTPRLEIPEWEHGRFGFGADIGVGTSIVNGELAGYFGPLTGLAFGAGFHYKRFNVDFRQLTAQGHSKKSFIVDDFNFYDTNRIQVNQSTFSFGYCLIDGTKLLLVPYLALSTFRVSNLDEPQGSLYREGPVSGNIEGGLLAEWNFYPLYQSNTSLFSWKLFCKAGYANVNYLHTIAGGALKFQVGIGFNTNTIRTIRSGQD